MAPFSDSSILAPVFLDGMLPRYGFCRCVACALGVVVPSAGLIGRGVAIEYPRGPWVCAETIRPEAKRSIEPSILEAGSRFPIIFCAIGSSFRTIGCR